MTQIYVIRHAEAEGNLYRRIQGQYDSLVTEMGMRQIEALRKRFENIDIDAVYSSDLYRTKATAAAVYAPKDLPLTTLPELREVNMGVWEDTCWADVERNMPEEYHNYNKAPHKWNVEGGESFYALAERITGTVKALAKKHDGESIAVVTHGGAIRALLCTIMKLPPEEITKIFYCDNTAVTHLIYENGELRIEYMNDNSHLPKSISAFHKHDWWKKEDFTDGTNIHYHPMDLEKRGQRFLDCYKDAWIQAHGSLEGFSDIYLEVAKKRSREFPMSVLEAFLGDKSVGILELNIGRDEEQGAGCIAFYYMDEPYRGKGLAVQLLGEATSIYRRLGRRSLRLRVAETNKRAIAFYQKFGFRQIGKEDGNICPLLIMEKNISLE